MKLLGEWNWYLPSWLEWLPRIGGEDAPPPPVDRPGPDSPDGRKPAPIPA
jgi:RND superfamily putative drug exporter